MKHTTFLRVVIKWIMWNVGLIGFHRCRLAGICRIGVVRTEIVIVPEIDDRQVSIEVTRSLLRENAVVHLLEARELVLVDVAVRQIAQVEVEERVVVLLHSVVRLAIRTSVGARTREKLDRLWKILGGRRAQRTAQLANRISVRRIRM